MIYKARSKSTIPSFAQLKKMLIPNREDENNIAIKRNKLIELAPVKMGMLE